MEPPTCFIDVYADQKSGTAEILHYKVPVLGAEQNVDIFINLSLRPRYVTSENQLSLLTYKILSHTNLANVTSNTSRNQVITGDDNLKEFRKIIKGVLIECHANLESLLEATMEPFAAKMFTHGIITTATRKASKFSSIMGEFLAGLSFINDSHKICLRCQLFLECLFDQGGPLKDAAYYIAENWTAKIESRLNMHITFDIE